MRVRSLIISAVALCLLATTARAQDPSITDELIIRFLKGRATEQPELDRVGDQLTALDEKIETFRTCLRDMEEAAAAAGTSLSGLKGRAAIRVKCGATNDDGMRKERTKLLEQPEKLAAAAAGMKPNEYAKLKEVLAMYLGGSRNFGDAELKVLAARAGDLSNALGITLAKAAQPAGGGGVGGRVSGAIGARMRMFTPDMTWAYVGYLWGIMYMSGATMFEKPYQPGQWTTWEIKDSGQPDTKLVLERALISREADKSEWWRIKTITVTPESSDTITLESLFKPLDEDAITMQVVRMRGKMPGESEGKELMVPQHLSMLSAAAFPFKPTAESLAGATVGTESVKTSTATYSAKHVKFGAGGGSMEWWLADNAPGGVVRVQFAGNDKDETWIMEMTGAGSGAKSELGVK